MKKPVFYPFRNSSLSIVFTTLFLVSLVGQIFTGWKQYNKQLLESGLHDISVSYYLTTGHFAQATFENWESEFLQMTCFVFLTVFLYQRGSSESKKLPDEEPEGKKPLTANGPWPVRRGGWILKIYNYSLSITLFILFIISFIFHFRGSWRDENANRLMQGDGPLPAIEYLTDSRFWFESFQNWQSEFLSVVAIVVLSIFLRHKGSPQSKPVEKPHWETGSE